MDASAKPELRKDLIRLPIDDSMIYVSAEPRVVVVVDAFLRVICESFDGSNTVDELASDVAFAGGVSHSDGLERIKKLVTALRRDHLLADAAGHPSEPAVLSRRAGSSLRFAIGDEAVAVVASAEALDAVASVAYRHGLDRVGGSDMGVRHVLKVVERKRSSTLHLDNTILWVGPSGAPAHEALTRAFVALVGSLAEGAPWLAAFCLVRDGRVLLVTEPLVPSVRHLLARLAEVDIVPLPGGVLCIEDADANRLVAAAMDGADVEPLAVAGILLDRSCGHPDLVRSIVDLGMHLGQRTVIALRELSDHLPPVVVPESASEADLLDTIGNVVPPAAMISWEDDYLADDLTDYGEAVLGAATDLGAADAEPERSVEASFESMEPSAEQDEVVDRPPLGGDAT